MQRYKQIRFGKPKLPFDRYALDHKGRAFPYKVHDNVGPTRSRAYWCHPTKGWRNMSTEGMKVT